MRARFSAPVACTCGALLLAGGCGDDDSPAWSVQGGRDGGSDATGLDSQVVDGAPDGAGGAAGDSAAEAAVESGSDAGSPQGPVLYPSDRTHSPITPWVAAHLSEILAKDPASRRDVFMKVGDSITASDAFLDCFAKSAVELDAHASLQPTVNLFKAQVGGTTSWDRTSLCVEIGRTAYWAMSGSPSPLSQELSAAHGAVAVAMYGSNDIGWFADHADTIDWYHGYMFDLVDALIAAGVVPILSTIPPRDDNAELDAWVPVLNAVVRAIAQGRQIPLVDLHRELMPLAEHGLSGDNLHPNSYSGGACNLSPAGLAFGYNTRNLLTLEALDRVRRAAIDGAGAPDDTAATMQGEGTPAAPFIVQGSPFTDVRDTSKSKSRALGTYSGCSSTANEGGAEYVYRLELDKASTVRAMVLDRGGVDIDVHVLGAEVSEAGCIARDDTMVELDLGAGTYHLSLDTYVSNGAEKAGEYTLVVLVAAK